MPKTFVRILWVYNIKTWSREVADTFTQLPLEISTRDLFGLFDQ